MFISILSAEFWFACFYPNCFQLSYIHIVEIYNVKKRFLWCYFGEIQWNITSENTRSWGATFWPRKSLKIIKLSLRLRKDTVVQISPIQNPFIYRAQAPRTSDKDCAVLDKCPRSVCLFCCASFIAVLFVCLLLFLSFPTVQLWPSFLSYGEISLTFRIFH